MLLIFMQFKSNSEKHYKLAFGIDINIKFFVLNTLHIQFFITYWAKKVSIKVKFLEEVPFDKLYYCNTTH